MIAYGIFVDEYEKKAKTTLSLGRNCISNAAVCNKTVLLTTAFEILV